MQQKEKNLYVFVQQIDTNKLISFFFQGARGLPGERGRVGAPGPAVSGFLSVCLLS